MVNKIRITRNTRDDDNGQTPRFDRQSDTECGAIQAKARNVTERFDGEPPLAFEGDAESETRDETEGREGLSRL